MNILIIAAIIGVVFISSIYVGGFIFDIISTRKVYRYIADEGVDNAVRAIPKDYWFRGRIDTEMLIPDSKTEKSYDILFIAPIYVYVPLAAHVVGQYYVYISPNKPYRVPYGSSLHNYIDELYTIK